MPSDGVNPKVPTREVWLGSICDGMHFADNKTFPKRRYGDEVYFAATFECTCLCLLQKINLHISITTYRSTSLIIIICSRTPIAISCVDIFDKSREYCCDKVKHFQTNKAVSCWERPRYCEWSRMIFAYFWMENEFNWYHIAKEKKPYILLSLHSLFLWVYFHSEGGNETW